MSEQSIAQRLTAAYANIKPTDLNPAWFQGGAHDWTPDLVIAVAEDYCAHGSLAQNETLEAWAQEVARQINAGEFINTVGLSL